MSGERQRPEELRAIYDRRYVERYRSKPLQRLERLVPLMDLRPGDAALDLGCGNGMLLLVLQGRVASYDGVDFSAEFIEEARAARGGAGGTTAQFHCESVTEFCAAHPAAFDRAFAMDFSEHVYDEEWLAITRAIRGSLRPGGILYLHTPDGEFFLETLKRCGLFPQLRGHVAVRDAGANEALLREAGFSEVKLTRLPHYLPLLSWLHLFSGLPLVGRRMRARLWIEARC